VKELDTALGTIKELGDKVEKLHELASNNSKEITFIEVENLYPLQEEVMGTNSVLETTLECWNPILEFWKHQLIWKTS